MPLDNIYDLIDRYLLGELKGKELDEFLKKMKLDPELAKDVASQKELIDLMEYHDNTLQMKSKLNDIHSEIDINIVRKQLGLTGVNSKMKNRKLAFTTLLVAASISILITFGTLFFSGWFSYLNDDHLDVYTELRKEIEDISSTQESLQKAISNNEKSKKLTRYNGTGFALASNGYIVTNYHVVRDVDSILIVNKTDSLVKYRACLVYKELYTDIAILKIEDTNFTTFGEIPYAFKEDISDLGEYVYTLGYSKSDIVFNEGSISALTGYKGDTTAYQISIPVNPGNSGGPLIDDKGYLLGIISGKHSRKAGATYAIKSSYLLNIIDSIKVDSLSTPPDLPSVNSLKWNKRTEQINKLRRFIFKVEVYK